MIIALIIFLITYVLMLSFQQYRPWIALSSAAIFIILGYAGLFDLNLPSALAAVDYNVLLMIGGTMGTVTLFIESRMPARLAEILITKVPNVKWARLRPGSFCRRNQRLRGQCSHGSDGSPRGPRHLPEIKDFPCSRPDLYRRLLQPAGSGHPGGRYHQHSSGRIRGHDIP